MVIFTYNRHKHVYSVIIFSLNRHKYICSVIIYMLNRHKRVLSVHVCFYKYLHINIIHKNDP
jgi:hypothetical protein